MGMTYRTDDLTKWGTGKGSNLTKVELDNNFWTMIQRIVALEDRPIATGGIDYFEISGDQLYVHLVDDTRILGPYTLPKAIFRSRGAWQSTTSYSTLDTFTINGGLYVVNLPHTSAATFDAGANDGLGNDYYTLMIQTPGSALPTGGATGQILGKSSGTDFAVTWVWKTPAGGTAGKFLRQKSSTQDDTEWATPQADEIEFVPPTGSTITSTNVADALQELTDGGAMHASAVLYIPNTGSGLTSTNVEDALNEIGSRAGVGRQTLWVPASGMTPLITNGAVPGVIETSVYKNIINTLDFIYTDYRSAQIDVAMPKSWDGGDLYFRFFWSHASIATSDFNVTWAIDSLAFSNGQSLDNSVHNEITIVDTGGTADTMYVSDIAGPMSGIDDTMGTSPPVFPFILTLQVWRNTGTANILPADARLHGVQIYYNTSTATDNE